MKKTGNIKVVIKVSEQILNYQQGEYLHTVNIQRTFSKLFKLPKFSTLLMFQIVNFSRQSAE